MFSYPTCSVTALLGDCGLFSAQLEGPPRHLTSSLASNLMLRMTSFGLLGPPKMQSPQVCFFCLDQQPTSLHACVARDLFEGARCLSWCMPRVCDRCLSGQCPNPPCLGFVPSLQPPCLNYECHYIFNVSQVYRNHPEVSLHVLIVCTTCAPQFVYVHAPACALISWKSTHVVHSCPCRLNCMLGALLVSCLTLGMTSPCHDYKLLTLCVYGLISKLIDTNMPKQQNNMIHTDFCAQK